MPAPEPDEHRRYQLHLRALAAVDAGDEVALVVAVLGDPDRAMAESAVAAHLERRATAMLADRDRDFDAWRDCVAGAVDGSPFLVGRLREWGLLHAVAVGRAWSSDELVAASDWCQRTGVRLLRSPAALAVLADRGRTRRVRAGARQRLAGRPG